jgi:hypothetical protein
VQDLKDSSYKHGKVIYLTMKGVELLANYSNNPSALKNKNTFLAQTKKLSAELLATMHVSSSSASASGAKKGPAPPIGPNAHGEGGRATDAEPNQDPHLLHVQKYAQSFGVCTQSLLEFNTQAVQIPDAQKLQAMTTEVVKYGQSLNTTSREMVDHKEIVDGWTHSLKEFSQEYSKFKTEVPGMKEVVKEMVGARQSLYDMDEKFVLLDERRMKLQRDTSLSAEANVERQVAMDSKAGESKKRLLDVDYKGKADLLELENLDKAKKIELDKQASLAAKEIKLRELEVEQKLYEFSELKRKRAKEEEAEEEAKKQQKKEDSSSQQQQDTTTTTPTNPGDQIITVRDIAEELYNNIFAGAVITRDEYATILKNAGGRCARKYEEAKLDKMPRIKHGEYRVASYKRKDVHYVIDALKWAFDEHKKLKKAKKQNTQQNTLDNMSSWTKSVNTTQSQGESSSQS